MKKAVEWAMAVGEAVALDMFVGIKESPGSRTVQAIEEVQKDARPTLMQIRVMARRAAERIAQNTQNASLGQRWMFEEYIEEQTNVIIQEFLKEFNKE